MTTGYFGPVTASAAIQGLAYPDIPNDWLFKEQELKALEARRNREMEESEEKKALAKERRQKRKLGMLEDEEMQDQGSFGEERVTNDSVVKANSHDHSKRAFYKELVKVIEASDVILQVLDARDPLGTCCIDMEKMVLKSGLRNICFCYSIRLILSRVKLLKSGSNILGRNCQQLPLNVARKNKNQILDGNLH